MITYTNYTNIDAAYCRPYEPGDLLVRGWMGEVDDDLVSFTSALHDLAEIIFARHNSDNRPDGQLCPSMSVGDVVVFGEVALSVDRTGFKVVQLDPHDLVDDRTWKEMAL